MKYLKIFLILVAVYSVSIPVAMVLVPEVFKSALTTYLLSAPLYGALVTYYFYWRNNHPAGPTEEMA